MIEEILEALAPLMFEAFLAIASIAIAYGAILLRRYTGINVEAKHREALHQALTTGAERVISAASDGQITKAEWDEMKREVLQYVQRSVPDALRHLVRDDGILWDMAEAKLRQVLGARTPL